MSDGEVVVESATHDFQAYGNHNFQVYGDHDFQVKIYFMDPSTVHGHPN